MPVVDFAAERGAPTPDLGVELGRIGACCGWHVYGPGSAHRPTVAGGRALVLYVLPGGKIGFTG